MARADPGLLGLVFALAVGCFASSATAAPPDSNGTRGSGALIFELGFADAIHRSNSGVDSRFGTIDAGYLRRTGDRTLVGGDLSFSFHDAGSFWALRPRLRRELDRNWGVDLAAGVIVAGQANAHEVDGLGVSALTELHYRGVVGVTLGLQSVKYSPLDKYGMPIPSPYSGRVTTTQLGVRVGNRYGLIGAVALGVAALVAVASL